MENKEVNKLINSLNNLVEDILREQSNFNDSFINERYGYNHYPCLKIDDLADIPENIIHKIKCRPYEFPTHILESMEYISERVNDSKKFVLDGLNSSSNINYLYSFMMTMTWVDKFVYQSIEWELLPENVMPTTLRNRLAIQKRAITNLEKSSVGLDEKVKQINSAYQTAKNLPTVQDDLEEALEKVRSSNIEIEQL